MGTTNHWERWRQHKSNLKSMYFDPHKTYEANINNVPEGVIADQWNALVNNWMTPKAQDLSEANRMNCGKRKAMHTAGPKSFARNREELKEKDPEHKYPHRAVLYIHTHQANKNNKNVHVGELKTLLVEQPYLADTSQGKGAWKGDAPTRILCEDRPGHVHGLGLVPNPDKVLDGTTSWRLKHLNLTSLDATSSEDIISLRLQMEKLVKRVENQDATIQHLQQKSICFQQQQIAHGSLVDPMSTPEDVQTTSKRKRVYGATGSEEFEMLNIQNSTRSEQSDDEFEDLEPHEKYSSTITKRKVPNATDGKLLRANRVPTTHKAHPKELHTYNTLNNNKDTDAAKGMNQETTFISSYNEESRYQTQTKQKGTHITSEIRKCTNAPKVTVMNKSSISSSKQEASNYKCGTTERASNGSILVGTEVYIKSWTNPIKKVALGTVLGQDPKHKVGGVQVGKEFWMVRVGLVVKPG